MSNILKAWLGDSTKEELKKFFFLAVIFIFTIGIYWFLRTSKDGVFNSIVGFDWQPFAKWMSLAFVIPVTIIYGILVDKFPKHQVFYVLSFVYGIGALIFAFLLSNDSIGLLNYNASPYRILGWAYYLFVESFGSVFPILFWTYAADTTMPEIAKRWFPFMAFMAQFGALFGSMVNAGRFGKFPITNTLMYCSIAIFLIAFLIFSFVRIIPKDQLKSYNEETTKKDNKKTGFLEGFKLVFSQPYLIGIFFSVTIFEVVATLFDFRFKVLVGDAVSNYVIENNIPISEIGHLKTEMFNEWVGWMGEWAAILGLIAYIFGVGKIGRYLGLTISLLVLPALLIAVAIVCGGTKSLMISGIAIIIAKGLNYVIFQPSKEQLYIPTSKDAKYKSKSFIDSFGSRMSKASGSMINAVKFYFPMIFPMVSLLSPIALCIIWLFISIYLGKKYDNAVAKKDVVC